MAGAKWTGEETSELFMFIPACLCEHRPFRSQGTQDWMGTSLAKQWLYTCVSTFGTFRCRFVLQREILRAFTVPGKSRRRDQYRTYLTYWQIQIMMFLQSVTQAYSEKIPSSPNRSLACVADSPQPPRFWPTLWVTSSAAPRATEVEPMISRLLVWILYHWATEDSWKQGH